MSTVIQPPAETKAQRAERLKREKNPWEALDEVRSFAPRGFSAIPEAWLKNYFRWWGIYTQGDGAGALGGSGGEGRAVPYFMIRIRLENGFLNSLQLRGIASLAERYARGIADITVRQNIQLHWINTEDLPLVMETLFSHGLTSQSTCGDVTRNITGCPLAGINAHEPFDASPLAFGASQMLVGNPDFYNLPRKYKISISGCPDWCSYPEINDVAFTPAVHEGEKGFSLRIGGGLSTEPHLALKLNTFVRWNQVLAVLTAVTEIFREADCLRENRERARLKYLFLRHGWTPDSFLAEVERRLGFRLAPAGEENVPADIFRDHSGVHPQKQSGLCYVGAAVLRGRVTPKQMMAAADLADRHGTGDLRTTNTQNLVIINVPTAETSQVVAGLQAVGLHVEASTFWRGAVACSGTEFCKLAITETKSYTRWLVEELEERLPGFDQQIRINVTGCPNSCGQHRLADIGLEGKKMKVNGRMTDAYYFCLGGAVGQGAAFARPIGYRCTAEDSPESIERLMREYLRRRMPGENLRRFFARHADAELRAFLAGEEQEAALRDPSPGRPSHELEA